jgi:hypothetical protein
VRTALKIGARRDAARWGRCFKALFGIPFWSRSLADLETPDGFLNLFRVGYLVFAGRVRK